MLPLRLLTRRKPSSTCPDTRFCNSQRVRCFAAANGTDRVQKEDARPDEAGSRTIEEKPAGKLSLMEQLFPEESRRYDNARKAAQEILRLPLDRGVIRGMTTQQPTPLPTERSPRKKESPVQTAVRKAVMQDMRERGTHTSLLFLQAASPNLTENDFRRLIPQGKHVEGWTVEDADILKIIPVRNTTNLKQTGSYYLLFRSQIAALNYKDYVERIKGIASWQTPQHVDSPIKPPKDFLIDGIDAGHAVESFTLVPAKQDMKLRRVKMPLTPFLWSLVQKGGYPDLMDRPTRMPFELVMTLEGPQLKIPAIQEVFAASSAGRAVNWGGTERRMPQLSRWDPKKSVNHLSTNARAQAIAKRQAATNVDESSSVEEHNSTAKQTDETKRRSGDVVYILGFETERHMDSFRLYWHRRPMTYASSKKQQSADAQEDIPPVVNLSILW